MKRFLSVSVVLLSVYSVFAYEDADITNANSLASANIIVDQSQSPEKYNLDAKILRQEVIGMALKLKGVTLPEDYTCKKYFTDVIKNDWVCRAIEIAADNGIITKENKQANPTKYVTGSEALAMMMRAGGVNIEQYMSSDRNQLFIPQGTTNPQGWQIDVMNSATTQGIIFPYAINQEGFESPYQYSWNYNDFIVRREVFDFTQEILTKGSVENIKSTLHFSDRDIILTFKDASQKTEMDEKYKKVKNADMYISENPSGFDIIKIIDQKYLDSISQDEESSNVMNDAQGTEFFSIKNTISPLIINNQKWISLKINYNRSATFADGTHASMESEYTQCLYKMTDNTYFAVMTMLSGIGAHVDNCDFFIKNLSHIQTDNLYGIFKDANELTVFKKMVGEQNLGKFLADLNNFKQFTDIDGTIDNLGIRVFNSDIGGLIIDKDKKMWATIYDPKQDAILYFTNVSSDVGGLAWENAYLSNFVDFGKGYQKKPIFYMSRKNSTLPLACRTSVGDTSFGDFYMGNINGDPVRIILLREGQFDGTGVQYRGLYVYENSGKCIEEFYPYFTSQGTEFTATIQYKNSSPILYTLVGHKCSDNSHALCSQSGVDFRFDTTQEFEISDHLKKE